MEFVQWYLDYTLTSIKHHPLKSTNIQLDYRDTYNIEMWPSSTKMFETLQCYKL